MGGVALYIIIFRDLVVLVVPSRVSGRGYKIDPVCPSVCVSVS